MADEIQKGSDALYVIYATEVYKNVFTAKKSFDILAKTQQILL